MGDERLIVVSGPLAGKEFTVDGPVIIGRSPECTIVLDDKQVSRKHALVQRTRHGTFLKDQGSGNGTLVRKNRILEYRLSDCDVFQIGSVEIRYEGESAPLPAASPVGAHEDSRVKFKEGAAGTVESAASQTVFETLFKPPTETADSAELRATQERLAAIYNANQIISSEQNIRRLFERVLEQIFQLVPANNGVILLKNKDTDELSVAYEHTAEGNELIQVSSSIVQRAFDDGEALLVHDAAEDERFEAAKSIATGNISSAICVPLMAQDERLGVIYVDTRGTRNAFAQGDVELMVALSGPSAIAIKNVQYVEQLEEEFQTTLRLLANAIELRDHYTIGHTWRVTKFSVIIAAEMGWSDEKLKIVEMGGVLHDVGKIAVPDAVLRKPGRLTEEEYDQMKIHPEKGASLMEDSEKLRQLIPYCLYHHERYDGKGYPFGLKGEEIPIEGRVVAVADTFDAMTSTRPYRKGLDPEIAIAEIEKCKGTQFDPECADAFIRAFRAGKVDGILQAYHENDERAIVCPFCSTYVQRPDGSAFGDILECTVCRRHIKIVKVNEAIGGELVRDSDVAATEKAGATSELHPEGAMSDT